MELIPGFIITVAELRQKRRQQSRREPRVPAPACSRVPNADTAGAVNVLQVARQAEAAFGGFPVRGAE